MAGRSNVSFHFGCISWNGNGDRIDLRVDVRRRISISDIDVTSSPNIDDLVRAFVRSGVENEIDGYAPTLTVGMTRPDPCVDKRSQRLLARE